MNQPHYHDLSHDGRADFSRTTGAGNSGNFDPKDGHGNAQAQLLPQGSRESATGAAGVANMADWLTKSGG